MWSVERKGAGSFVRPTLGRQRQDQPMFHALSQRGQAPPQVCVPEPELCLWAWAGGMARWVRAP